MMRDTWQDVAPGTRVVVAMSGGVDSSVAAALLVERGCDVVGITMKNFCYAELPEEMAAAACCSLEAIEDARAVARTLGIPHHVLDFEGPFREAVIDPFVEEYAAGRTPNPCVRCNRFVRFPRLWRKARLLGAEFVATGHYARAVRGFDAVFRDHDTDFRDGLAGEVAILRPADRAKDQSFYLWGLGRPLLERALFPLGETTKDAVRAHAAGLGMRVAEKPESQDICFIPDGDLRGFLERYREAHPELAADRFAPGPVVSTAGEILGAHAGSAFLTVGQRRGIGVTAERPLYVTAVAAGNTVVAGYDEDLYADGLVAEDANWLADPPPAASGCSFRALAQIRYRSPAAPASLKPGHSRTVEVKFDEPQRAIAPGQSVVFYDGDRLLGGATIRAVTDP